MRVKETDIEKEVMFLLAVLLLCRSVFISHSKSHVGFPLYTYTIEGHVAIRYPSIGLAKSRTAASVLDPHFHPRQSPAGERRFRLYRPAWSGEPDTGDLVHDVHPGFEATEDTLSAVLRSHYNGCECPEYER